MNIHNDVAMIFIVSTMFLMYLRGSPLNMKTADDVLNRQHFMIKMGTLQFVSFMILIGSAVIGLISAILWL